MPGCGPVAEYRAILMSDEQRDAIDGIQSFPDARRQVASAFDAAGDQPCIRWCAEHGRDVFRCPWVGHSSPCRVVDAIVVPLPEQP
jgi:hypothetical protein